MPVTYIGATRHAGTSSKTQRPYDIIQVHYYTNAQDRKDLKYAAGCEPQSQQCSEDALSKFSRLQPGQQIELEWSPMPNNPQRNQVSGFKLAQAAG